MVSIASVLDIIRYDDGLGVLTVVPTDGDVQLVHSTDIATAMAGALATFRNHDHPYYTGVSYVSKLQHLHTCDRENAWWIFAMRGPSVVASLRIRNLSRRADEVEADELR
eukprot:9487753-Pyramimonas_sp.AAC.1